MNGGSHPASYGAVMHSARVIVQSQAGLGYWKRDGVGVELPAGTTVVAYSTSMDPPGPDALRTFGNVTSPRIW